MITDGACRTNQGFGHHELLGLAGIPGTADVGIVPHIVACLEEELSTRYHI
jgi:hypothetical protein